MGCSYEFALDAGRQGVGKEWAYYLLQYVGARTRAHTGALAQLQSSTQLRPALMVLAMQASAAGANGGTVCIMLT